MYLQKEIISHQDNSGNVVILYGTQKDITNDIIYQKNLEYNIKMTNYAIKASDIAFMIYDCESGSIIGYNDPINNYNDDITYNLDYYRSKMHPDDVEEINHRDTILLNRLDKSYSVNIRIKFDENEDWRYCTISGAPFEYDSKGRVKKFVGFRKDNTKFHNMSKDIEEYANRLKYILSSSKIVYWYYDIKTSVISSYYGTDNVLHQTKDEYLNKIYDLDKEDTLDQFNRMDNKTHSEFTLNRSYIDTNGEVKNAIINGIPIKDEQGDIIGYSGLKRDITNMINIQRRLFLEKENAEKSFRSNCESIIEFENLIKSKIKDILNLIDKKSNIEDIKIRESISHLLDLISNNSIESRLISDCIDPNDSYGDLSTDERNNRNITLLIVEDNDSNFLLISAILKDYILYRAKNGVEAIEFVKNKVFNAIIMDIEMPIMDGLEATKIIRDMGVEIPIIALTANAYASDKKNAFKAGCNLFLSKPIRKRDLLNALNSNSIIWK